MAFVVPAAAGAVVGAVAMNALKGRVHSGSDDLVRKTVLIDMDNTLVDFDSEFAKRWVKERPGDSVGRIKSRLHFELEENFPAELRPLAEKIMGTPGFYIEFAPQPGAIEAVRAMTAAGLNVVFCTAPHPLQYETCVQEKFAWVRRHLGEEYLSQLIITRDKTLVKGAVLIDDKPRVTGACAKPEWTHIVFDQPYNRDVETDTRLTEWPLWPGVLSGLVPFHLTNESS
eukprot:CAMPEP_0185841930 /NCGR_PEP_ID=MMETSP1353-20130828/18150_1 /TAXON_ID=1077150 /ORGANISM="Erythrolobus australicus, Strain CCMP3124" /LENGTH=227 /DNA_ID=CAMNT_0028541423 /DNA_START=15 /DNA_END=698 /DNA_ORIENTATION=+